ncbi:MAG: histidine phosphatase family protein [Helicobacter sp.]|nr:histidine phosphatase family protein [Helicobacter sp.]
MVSFRLILIRHALAYESHLWDGGDLSRPLLPKGKKQAKQVGKRIAKYLRQKSRAIDMVFVSEASRSVETAQYMLKHLPDNIPTSQSALINPESGTAGYLKLIEESLGEGHVVVVIVGHEYDLSHVVAHLCGECRLRWQKGGFLTLCLQEEQWSIEVV